VIQALIIKFHDTPTEKDSGEYFQIAEVLESVC
jgi:hypothetical protein